MTTKTLAPAKFVDCPGLQEGRYGHSMRDGCSSCAPYWETIPICPRDDKRLEPTPGATGKGYCRTCRRHFSTTPPGSAEEAAAQAAIESPAPLPPLVRPVDGATAEKLEAFRALLEADQLRGLIDRRVDCEANRTNSRCKVEIGAKYARVDVGYSGKYMVPLDTGEIFGIKAYGVIHRGHRYGTLDTIAEFDWSGYTAKRLQGVAS
jgi:hypothetical protein